MEGDDKDVFGKVDALMRRHGIAAPGGGGDTGGVPILTDLVEPPRAGPAQPGDAAELSAQVLQAVEARLARELEHRLAERLGGQLHEAVAAAVAELRGELSAMVAEAVSQAIERRHVK